MLGHHDVNDKAMSAIREGRLEEVRQLINTYGLKYLKEWSQGYVLLRSALEYGHSAIAALLLNRGSKVNNIVDDININHNTALHLAVLNGNIEVVDMLLDRNANVYAKNDLGKTALHMAIEYDKNEWKVAELLLEHGVDINAKDNGGESLLHVAVKRGCLQIVQQLLNYGAYVNAVCNRQYAPLHLAVEYGRRDVVTLLLIGGANINLKKDNAITPLHIAAQKGNLQIAENLLSHGSCIYSLTLKEGFTPLHFAADNGNEDIIKLFLNKGADINATTKDNLTPLHIAIQKGHKELVRLLLQHGAKVDAEDNDGKTILHYAIEKRSLKIVKDVLKYCPDINNESNRSSLETAVLGNVDSYKYIVEALQEYGFTINSVDANNSKIIHNAAENGYYKIVENLLKSGADVNAIHKSQSLNNDSTLLHRAVKHNHENVAKLLISHGADIHTKDKSGNTAIFYAIGNGDVNITNLLLNNGANIKDNVELLSHAVFKKSKEIVDILLQHGVDVNIINEGRTALHYTAVFVNDHVSCDFKSCLNHLKNLYPNDCSSSEDSSYEDHLYAEFTELLIKKGANIEAQTEEGETTLHIAAQKGNEEICIILLQAGANVHAIEANDYTALHFATEEDHENVVKVLLKYGANVNVLTKSNVTPLHMAALNGQYKTLKILLKHDADINLKDDSGRTALHIASIKGYFKLVQTLLDEGFDINITCNNMKTPLHYAKDGINNENNNINNMPVMADESDSDDDSVSDFESDYNSHIITVRVLQRHISKMKAANLYISGENLLSLCEYDDKGECGNEIANMKDKKIKNAKISYYQILTKNTNSIATYMRNGYTVKVLESGEYKALFPIYAGKCKFRKGMERKKLLEEANEIVHSYLKNLSELPNTCIENILSFLSNKDLKDLKDVCKSSGIHNTETHHRMYNTDTDSSMTDFSIDTDDSTSDDSASDDSASDDSLSDDSASDDWASIVDNLVIYL